jgi:DNA-binding NarL/FixJ family response regulator
MAAPDLDSSELAALRDAATALVGQNGTGIPRRALVELAEASARYAISVYAGNPPIAIAQPLADAELAGLFNSLTPREREVAALIASGHSNKAIAAELVISVATVKDHVHRILVKSGFGARAAVASAWQRAHRH